MAVRGNRRRRVNPSFRTAGGSTYTFDPSTRTTVRTKRHGSDAGLKDRSERTLFLDFDAPGTDGPEFAHFADVLSWVENREGRYFATPGGDWLALLEPDDSGYLLVKYRREPFAGASPLEFWGTRKSKTREGWRAAHWVHLGNDIVPAARNPALKPCDPSKRPLDARALKGQRVRVHLNLHNGCAVVSVSGRVQGYARGVTLKNAIPKISAAGASRCLSTKVRNVHAYLQGELVSGSAKVPSGKGWRRITYNCREEKGRAEFYYVKGGATFEGAAEVRLVRVGDRVQTWARGRARKENPPSCACRNPSGLCGCGSVPWSRNPDERTRGFERAASGGDPDELARFYREKRRAGEQIPAGADWPIMHELNLVFPMPRLLPGKITGVLYVGDWGLGAAFNYERLYGPLSPDDDPSTFTPWGGPYHDDAIEDALRTVSILSGGMMVMEELELYRPELLSAIHGRLLEMDRPPFVFAIVDREDYVERLPGWARWLPRSPTDWRRLMPGSDHPPGHELMTLDELFPPPQENPKKEPFVVDGVPVGVVQKVVNKTFYWATDRPAPIGLRVPASVGSNWNEHPDGQRLHAFEVLFEQIRAAEFPHVPPRIGGVFVCPTLHGFCGSQGWIGWNYVYEVTVTGSVFTTDAEGWTSVANSMASPKSDWVPRAIRSYWRGWWSSQEELDELFMGGPVLETLVSGSVVVSKLVRGPDPRQNPPARPCGSSVSGPDLGVHLIQSRPRACVVLLDLKNVRAYQAGDIQAHGSCPLLAGWGEIGGRTIAREGLDAKLHQELSRPGLWQFSPELAGLAERLGMDLLSLESQLCREGAAWWGAKRKPNPFPFPQQSGGMDSTHCVVYVPWDGEKDLPAQIKFCGSHNDCFAWILNNQGQSVDWAIKHGGYSIQAAPWSSTERNPRTEETIGRLRRAAAAGDQEAKAELFRNLKRAGTALWIEVDGDVHWITEVVSAGWPDGLVRLTLEEDPEDWGTNHLIVSEDEDRAGEAFVEMIRARVAGDPDYPRRMVPQAFASWARGEAGFTGQAGMSGGMWYQTLEDWIEGHADFPEMLDGGGEILDVDGYHAGVPGALGFEPGVAFRG
jgi:hypothetical protein